jgi:branched-chain amino acid aminotransferase
MDIKVTLTKNSRLSEVDFNNIQFGSICSDHMFVADYINGEWTNFEIKPLANMTVHPAIMSLHYGQSIFEGLKASMMKDGTPVLFRPDEHAKRFVASADRMCMPEFPVEMFLKAVTKLVGIDSKWVPKRRGSSMYIRPIMFATDAFIGVRASEKYRFMILTLPVGPYYNKPVSLLAETTYTRAAQGGVGEAKCAGNYGGALYPAKLARQQGFDQVLWLDAKEFKYIQEVGTMNIFFVMNETVVTPATVGTILKGVTRESAIEILRDRGYKVEVRRIHIDEIVEAHHRGELSECFGTGTAALIAHVEKIKYKDLVMPMPSTEDVSLIVKEEINGLRDGSVLDTRGWIWPVPVTANMLISEN